MSTVTSERPMGGIGTLLGPFRNTQFRTVVELVKESLPPFATYVVKRAIKNENGLNHDLCLYITATAQRKRLPFIAQHQSIEDDERGNSPAPDIGIHLLVDDTAAPPPRITVFEGKRLTKAIERKRRKEYVFGHEEMDRHICCGGIERFKSSIHAHDLEYAGMIGYVQDGTPEEWLEQINVWISELSREQHRPEWSEEEQLISFAKEKGVAQAKSTVRRNNDALHLLHLWISLVE